MVPMSTNNDDTEALVNSILDAMDDALEHLSPQDRLDAMDRLAFLVDHERNNARRIVEDLDPIELAAHVGGRTRTAKP